MKLAISIIVMKHTHPTSAINRVFFIVIVYLVEFNKTRMHSSGMHTAHLLTVSQHALCREVCIPACTGQGVYLPTGGCTCPRGVYLPTGGVPARGCTCPGDCTCLGVYLPRGCTCSGVYLPGGCTCPGRGTCSGGGVPAWGVYLPGGVPAWEICTWPGVPAWGVYLSMQWADTPPCRHTDTCENITFANFVCGR